ncbi:NADPH-dependent FMN reductase, partial [Mesorhizobium sp. Cs1330R2N1]
HLISAGRFGEIDGYVGYMEPYATSHRDLDEDREFQQEVRNVACALGNAIRLARSGRLDEPGEGLEEPNPK